MFNVNLTLLNIAITNVNSPFPLITSKRIELTKSYFSNFFSSCLENSFGKVQKSVFRNFLSAPINIDGDYECAYDYLIVTKPLDMSSCESLLLTMSLFQNTKKGALVFRNSGGLAEVRSCEFIGGTGTAVSFSGNKFIFSTNCVQSWDCSEGNAITSLASEQNGFSMLAFVSCSDYTNVLSLTKDPDPKVTHVNFSSCAPVAADETFLVNIGLTELNSVEVGSLTVEKSNDGTLTMVNIAHTGETISHGLDMFIVDGIKRLFHTYGEAGWLVTRVWYSGTDSSEVEGTGFITFANCYIQKQSENAEYTLEINISVHTETPYLAQVAYGSCEHALPASTIPETWKYDKASKQKLAGAIIGGILIGTVALLIGAVIFWHFWKRRERSVFDIS